LAPSFLQFFKERALNGASRSVDAFQLTSTISVFMTSARTAGFDILKEPFEYRIEVSWRFPERGVPQPAHAVKAAFPQVGVRHVIEVAEIDEAVRAAVHHCERNPTAFHDQTLIHTCSATRGFEEPLAKTAVSARDGLPEECLG
jgi:hypothetical protein